MATIPRPTLDATDQRLLEHLQRDARTSTADLARGIGLSASPTAERVRRLATLGSITTSVVCSSPLPRRAPAPG